MNKSDRINGSIQELMQQQVILPVQAGSESYVIFKSDESQKAYSLLSKDCEMALRLLFRNQFGIRISRQEYQDLQDDLEMLSYEQPLDYRLADRVFNDESGAVVYDLDQDHGRVVWIEDGKCEVCSTEVCLFKRSSTYEKQVMPDLNAEPGEIIPLVQKHFNLASMDNIILMALYLISSLVGLKISHPILALIGEKGSSKSTTMRKLVRIIDPQTSDLGSLPRNAGDLELRLANSYLVTLDNLSFIRQNVSDLLARAATGGSVTKRKLYSDRDEVVLDIKSLVILNGVSMVVHASDLADRCLFMELTRLDSAKRKTEEEIWQSFEEDLPRILGSCFNALAVALNDQEELKTNEWIRMADWHELCLRIGRAIHVEERHINHILSKNQQYGNEQILSDNMTAFCLIELMRNRTEYKGSVTQLRKDLIRIADENGISESLLPKTPNRVSRELNLNKSNLEQLEGITYQIVKVKSYREIRITKIEKPDAGEKQRLAAGGAGRNRVHSKENTDRKKKICNVKTTKRLPLTKHRTASDRGSDPAC